MLRLLTDYNFNSKKTLVRCDFNVSFDEKAQILDDFKIKKALLKKGKSPFRGHRTRDRYQAPPPPPPQDPE